MWMKTVSSWSSELPWDHTPHATSRRRILTAATTGFYFLALTLSRTPEVRGEKLVLSDLPLYCLTALNCFCFSRPRYHLLIVFPVQERAGTENCRKV